MMLHHLTYTHRPSSWGGVGRGEISAVDLLFRSKYCLGMGEGKGEKGGSRSPSKNDSDMPSSSQSTLLDSATETHLAEPRYGGFGLWSVGPGFIVGLNIVVLALPNGYPYIVAQYPPQLDLYQSQPPPHSCVPHGPFVPGSFYFIVVWSTRCVAERGT